MTNFARDDRGNCLHSKCIDNYGANLQILFINFAMKHERVNVQKLTKRLRQAVGRKSPAEIAAAAKVDPSRVTRFLNGEFRKMTPVLKQVCSTLKIPVDEFLLDSPASELPPDILVSLRKIVGRNGERAAAATRLFRSLEVLVGDRRLRPSGKRLG
jgi:transcriptional regulator with XRE-family HTH domain